MILVFEKTDGLKVAVSVGCIVDIEECEDCTRINTIVTEIEVINDYDEVVRMVAKYQSIQNIIFNKN